MILVVTDEQTQIAFPECLGAMFARRAVKHWEAFDYTDSSWTTRAYLLSQAYEGCTCPNDQEEIECRT